MKRGNTLDMEELVAFAQLVDYLIVNYYRKGSGLATKQRERSGRFFCAVQDLLWPNEGEEMTST